MKKNTNKAKKQNSGVKSGKQAEAKETFAFYIGIDLGDKNCEVCVLDQQGELQESFRLAMKAAIIQGHFLTIARSRVAIEAGGQSRWVAEVIEQCGHQLFVSNTRKVAYI